MLGKKGLTGVMSRERFNVDDLAHISAEALSFLEINTLRSNYALSSKARSGQVADQLA